MFEYVFCLNAHQYSAELQVYHPIATRLLGMSIDLNSQARIRVVVYDL